MDTQEPGLRRSAEYGSHGRPDGIPVGRFGTARPSIRNLKTFTSFKSPVFRLYYAAMLGQMAAMNMQMLTRTLLIYRITGSATILGVMALANAAPMLFFSLFGGVIADRVQKKYVLLVGQITSAGVSLGVALALVSGYLDEASNGSWWVLAVASLAQGTIMGLMMPSRQAMIAEIVGEEQLMNAVALNTLGMNLSRLLMPALAGFMIEGFGFASTYFFMTAMYLLAVVFILPMPNTGSIAIRGGGAISDIVDGIRYVRHETTILMLLILTFLTVLFSMPYMMLLPVFTEDLLDVGASGMGILVSVSGIGAMAGSIVLASLPNKKRGAMLMWGSLLLGIGLIGFSFSSSWIPAQAWPLALGFILIVGLGQTVRMTLGNTLLQYYVDPVYRGRVMSLYMMEFGLTSFAVFLTGIAADQIGIQWSVGGLAILLVILSAWVLAFVPRIRRLD
jgi:MFS family permease